MAKGKKKKVDKEPQLRPRISAAAAAAASSPFYPPETNGSSAGSSRKKIGPQDSERIRRLSREGISIDVISKIWNATPKEVLETLELEPKDSAREEACAPLVKRLTTDPAELCCPISRQLMWDPVVAQDGYTYERCNIERWLGTKPQSPMTGTPLPTPAVLNPNQHVKSAIRSFKEDTVAEILALVPQLPSTSVALELLSRGEQFVRPDLPDASAQKKLTSLLRLRMKLPGGGEAIQEIVGLFLENPHRGGLQKFLCELDGSQLTYVLPELDDDTIAILQKGKKLQPACKWLVDQELSRRLAGRLTEECPLKLMRLLEESSQSPHDEKGDRLKAAGLVLASSIDRLDAEDLEEMDVQLLSYARGYLRDKDTAIMDSEHFFSTDLGMFTAERWPPQSSGAILTELAFRLEDEEEKFQLLVEAHEIDGADSQVRAALIQQLHGKIYRSDSQASESTSRPLLEPSQRGAAEGLFLKLILEERQQIPSDILPKLTLEKGVFEHLSPDELLLLADQLSTAERHRDGGRVAVKAAKAYGAKGKDMEAHSAYLHAFRLDRFNDDAAEGLVRTSLAMKKQAEELKSKCEELERRCHELDARLMEGAVTAEHTPPRHAHSATAQHAAYGKAPVAVQELLLQRLQAVQDSWQSTGHSQEDWSGW